MKYPHSPVVVIAAGACIACVIAWWAYYERQVVREVSVRHARAVQSLVGQIDLLTERLSR